MDLIDRSKLIKAMNVNCKVKDDRDAINVARAFNKILDIIHNAPTIDVPTWIPCEERLPNNDEEVIVSIADDRADNIFRYTTTAWRYGDVWVSDNERICDIIAWMPLPKAYEEKYHE